jgi:hypothetical protein
MDYFLAGSPAILSVHTHYGFYMDCTWNGVFHGLVHGQSIWIPYGFHGISNELQLQIHVLVHMDSIHGILRDLNRIVINVFKHNLIPLLYIYI